MLEFFWSPYSNNLMVYDLNQGQVYTFTEDNHDLIDKVCRKLRDDYPDNWDELLANYSKSAIPMSYAIKFTVVNRFLKCNFSANDNKPDIDDDFNFEFEKVLCPMRGECTKGYCTPKLATQLSPRELEIIPYLVDGMSHQRIGDILYVSAVTIKNHTYKIYQKLGFTGKDHPDKLLINYAYKNKLIQNRY